MGTWNCAGFVLGGGRTQFDHMIGTIEEVEEQVLASDIPTEFHPGDGPVPEGYSTEATTTTQNGAIPHVVPHFCDRKADLLERLAEAKEQVDEIWYLVLEALEAVN